jgi:uncharacterized protein YutE (UPF0331/DUF86 family)
MVDSHRITKIMERLEGNLRLLESEQEVSAERASDPLWLPGIKYLFVVAIEDCIDIAQHICAVKKLGAVRDNGHSFVLLSTGGVIPLGLSEDLRRAVGFRNVLVHEYVDVDDQVVLRSLAELGDLRAFSQRIAQWLLGEC